MKRTFIHTVECPQGHEFNVRRRYASAGYVVDTWCPTCEKSFPCSVPDARLPAERVLHERDIETHLVQRVKRLGGEVRKVQWIGRNGAPDRLVMLPATATEPKEWRKFAEACNLPREDWRDHLLGEGRPARSIWVEVKAPGLAAKFPRNAHERAQQREHERMRRMGQRVEVVDSYEQIEELLK